MTDKTPLDQQPGEIGFNNFLHIKRAAYGDPGALEMLAARTALCASYARDIITTTEALVFARMAAVRGGFNARARVVSLLAIAGDACDAMGGDDWQLLSDALAGEGMARVSLLLDDGADVSEEWADQFNVLVERSTPKATEYSMLFRKALIEAEGLV